MTKVGRNEPCPCGSGKKHKRCCLFKQEPNVVSLGWQNIRRVEMDLVPRLMAFGLEQLGESSQWAAGEDLRLWGVAPQELTDGPMVEVDGVWYLYLWLPEHPDAETLPLGFVNDMPAQPFKVPVAQAYLERHGSRLNSYEKRFIRASVEEPLSFWQVVDVEPGERMRLRDLLRDEEKIVYERTASESMPEGMVVLARVITLDGNSVLSGLMPMGLSPDYAPSITRWRRNIEEARGAKFCLADCLLDYCIEVLDTYYDLLHHFIDPPPPVMQNTDGELIAPQRLTYRLNCSPRDAFDALKTLQIWGVDEVLETDLASYDNSGALSKVQLDWLEKKKKPAISRECTVYGVFIIDGSQLRVEVNSYGRAESVRRRVGRRLSGRAEYLGTESIELDQLTRPPPTEQDAAQMMDDPQVLAQIEAMAKAHWDNWLDESLPALNGQTPRQAAKSRDGRRALEVLLTSFDSMLDNGPVNPMAPDVDALRRKLGL